MDIFIAWWYSSAASGVSERTGRRWELGGSVRRADLKRGAAAGSQCGSP